LNRDSQAYQGIKKLIYGRKLSPGQKIVYRDLEKLLNMSKTPLINALSRMEQEGLVVSHPNRGFYVKELSTEEIKQIYELKLKFMEIAIEYAIAHYNQHDLENLKSALDKYHACNSPIYDSARFILDIEFHVQIARMGKNQFLSTVLQQFYENAYLGMDVAFMTPLIEQFKKDHYEIYTAIKTKNELKAKAAMNRHIKKAYEIAAKAQKYNQDQ
jgi:DNA-binding GntR family transcriptional regulator